ncbi:hypothetical protein BKA62DRAFT_444060 [Auriculariales sp. MPI-PUGE-AT-0066]|nr:hypothetical protein BKA62DRAFT_444060 [Auriculariales sp. MPI-PUGE-AT-0066]
MPVTSASTPAPQEGDYLGFVFHMEGDTVHEEKIIDDGTGILQDVDMEEVHTHVKTRQAKGKTPITTSSRTRRASTMNHSAPSSGTSSPAGGRPRRAAAVKSQFAAQPRSGRGKARVTRSSSGRSRKRARASTSDEDEGDLDDEEEEDIDLSDSDSTPATRAKPAVATSLISWSGGRVLRTRVPKSAEKSKAEREAERAYREAVAE